MTLYLLLYSVVSAWSDYDEYRDFKNTIMRSEIIINQRHCVGNSLSDILFIGHEPITNPDTRVWGLPRHGGLNIFNESIFIWLYFIVILYYEGCNNH